MAVVAELAGRIAIEAYLVVFRSLASVPKGLERLPWSGGWGDLLHRASIRLRAAVLARGGSFRLPVDKLTRRMSLSRGGDLLAYEAGSRTLTRGRPRMTTSSSSPERPTGSSSTRSRKRATTAAPVAIPCATTTGLRVHLRLGFSLWIQRPR